MAQAAETGGGGSPYAKLTDLGDRLIGAFASAPRECQRQATKFKTNEPLWKDEQKTKPVLQEIMYFVVMPGTTAKKGNEDSGYEPFEEFDTALFAVQGYKWWQVIQARKALAAHAAFKAGQACSGDVYDIVLSGWSAETKNAAAAEKAGFTVIENRIVLRTQDEKDQYVLAQSRSGGNTNPAKDLEVVIRRPTSEDKAYEQRADELFLEKPWKRVLATVGGGADEPVEEEPF